VSADESAVGQLIYGTENQIGYLVIGIGVCLGFSYTAATTSSTGWRALWALVAAVGLVQAGAKARELRRHMPLMRLDRDGVQAAAACLRWADLDRIEIKSDADDSHATTIFILRLGAQLKPGTAGYNTHTSKKFKFTLGAGG
jgi:hypothetical protein